MPKYPVYQPDGRYAFFSTVVDGFTCHNLSRGEVREYMDRNGRLSEKQLQEYLRRAERGIPYLGGDASENSNKRWENSLQAVVLRGGPVDDWEDDYEEGRKKAKELLDGMLEEPYASHWKEYVDALEIESHFWESGEHEGEYSGCSVIGPDDWPPLTSDSVVFYHDGCFDGFTAAWAAYRALKEDAEYIPVSYDDSIPPEDVYENKAVYILDFSFSREEMETIRDRAQSLVVCDHHQSAKDRCEGLDFCTFDLSKSGARLAWEHFHPEKDVPEVVRYVEDRDLWNWELPSSETINFGIRSLERTFENWNTLYENEEEWFRLDPPGKLYKRGEPVVDLIEEQVKQQCENAREIQFPGTEETALATNSPVFQSRTGEELARRSDNNLGLVWCIRNDHLKGSIRMRGEKSGMNAREIAEKYEGGGHDSSAGFTVDEPLEFLQELL